MRRLIWTSAFLFTLGGCAGAESDTPGLRFDPCATRVALPDDASASERQAVIAALDAWNASGALALALAPASPEDADAGVPTLDVRFQGAAGAFHGLYDDLRGIVFVNRGLNDAHGRAVTVAHELGHAFGLQHVDPEERASLMNPGNLRIGPTKQDALQLRQLWGACSTRAPWELLVDAGVAAQDAQ